MLVACGGSNAPNAVAPPSGAPVSVSGTVRYERVAVNSASGSLNYNNITAMPVRGATVELIYEGSAFSSTQTNASGQYSFSAVPGSSTYAIRVRAELKQTTGAAQWDVSVRDNTNADALYTLQSANFIAGSAGTQNLTAASGWGGSSYTAARAAGPFAILDTIYASQQKVLAVQADAQFPLLRVFWSVNNNTSGSGQLRDGDIGTSFFTEVGSNDTVIDRSLYILGRSNDDTDEYDDSVVAHEWGHYYQSAFSRDDSMGGRHGGGDDRLDRRIAFSEGWGNAWSGIVLSKSSYADSSGDAQAGGFVLPLNSGYNTAFGGAKGWFREQSIQYILWSLNNQVGFQGMHQALTSTPFLTGEVLSDIHSFASAYRTVAASSATAILNGLLSSESISISDALGNAESNNGGNAVTLPYYRQITALGHPVTLAAGQTLCGTAQYTNTRNSSSASETDRNKLGLFVYVRFSLASAASRTITVTAANAAVDTDFEIHRDGQRIFRAETGTNSTETRTEILPAGNYVLVMFDYNKAWPGNTCYSVSIQ